MPAVVSQLQAMHGSREVHSDVSRIIVKINVCSATKNEI